MAKKMAKTPTNEAEELPLAQGQLGDWLEEVPEDVQEAADERMRTLRAKNKATEKYNSAQEACMQAMKEHDVKRIRIDDGKKWLVYDEKGTLKTEKIKSPSEED